MESSVPGLKPAQPFWPPPKYFMTSDDGSVKVGMFTIHWKPEEVESKQQEIKQSLKEYKWRDEDFLLAATGKNGTHFTWEIMTMLVRGSANYIAETKTFCHIDVCPLHKSEAAFPSPRVLNTHYRLDVLPKEFRGKKTVFVLRNPKDMVVSMYHHISKLLIKRFPDLVWAQQTASMSFDDFFKEFMVMSSNKHYGSYFEYVEYMWSLRDDPNMLIVYYEDLVMDPVANIEKLNEFMGTKRSADLVQKIADATRFNKMKEGKIASAANIGEALSEISVSKGPLLEIYRKGEVGDWKNFFTVAQNEAFDTFMAGWSVGQDIPFRY